MNQQKAKRSSSGRIGVPITYNICYVYLMLHITKLNSGYLQSMISYMQTQGAYIVSPIGH